MIKESQCFKYGKKSHLATDTDVLYKDQVVILDKQIVFDLKAMEVKTTFEHHKSDLKN